MQEGLVSILLPYVVRVLQLLQGDWIRSVSRTTFAHAVASRHLFDDLHVWIGCLIIPHNTDSLVVGLFKLT